MKDFIMAFAIFLILLFFPLQWTLNQVNHYRIQTVTNIVHVAVQKARIDGYFKDSTINEMRAKVAEVLSISDHQIRIDVTTIPKYRFSSFNNRELISYEIGIPIEKVIAMNRFFGIDDQLNQYEYIIKGEVTSELLAP